MEPNYASAVILNNAVKAYNIINSKRDIVISMEEFAANFDAVSKNLYLLYGLSNIHSNNYSYVNDTLVFGKGLAKSNLINNIVELPSANDKQFGYRISEILGSNTEISNCYVFAALYLTCDGSTINTEFSLGKSVSDEEGDVFILSRDINIDDAMNIAIYSTDIIYPEPTGATQSTLLFKFIVDVELYDGIDKNSRAFFTVLDERKPRSFYSISDERASSIITPAMFALMDSFDYMNTIHYNSLTQVITDWIELDSWSPSFAHYWYDADPALPTELKNFIRDEIQYDLTWQITPTGLSSLQAVGSHGLVT
jgi:hypothetical protein